MTASDLMDAAFRAAAAGDLSVCAQHLETLLASSPGHVEGLRLLGKVRLGTGNIEDGLRLLTAAAALAPDHSDLAYEVGVARLQAGLIAEAEGSFRRHLVLAPGSPAGLFNLAWCLRRRHQHEEAISLLRQLVIAEPRHGDAFINLGNALSDLCRWDEAAAAYERAVSLSGGRPDLVCNLGLAHLRMGQIEVAKATLNSLPPKARGDADALTLEGEITEAEGQVEAAAACFARAAHAAPTHIPAGLRHAQSLRRAGRHGEAVRVLAALVLQAPDHVDLLLEQADMVMDLQQGDLAEASLRRALELEPCNVAVLNAWGKFLTMVGRRDEALSAFRRASEITPDDNRIASNLLFLMLHDPDTSPEKTFAAHRDYGRRLEALIPPRLWRPSPGDTPGRRLRIGYVSPDFCAHAVTLFFEPLLAGHDREHFEIFCYHIPRRVDATTKRLRQAADGWRVLPPLLSPYATRDLILRDGIDILVDLAGHTNGGILPLFAAKPAPILVSGIGYPGTTGLSRMDYRLRYGGAPKQSDQQQFSTETLVPMPTALPIALPDNAPEVAPPPMLANDFVTFGSVNRFAKVTAPVIAVWARILAAVPRSHLLVVHPLGDTKAGLSEVRAMFAEAGINPDRIETVGERPVQEWLGILHRVDIALDPFPYFGGSTSTMCNWMGVPVLSLNKAADHEVVIPLQLDAMTEERYVAVAVELASDPVRLTRWRALMRPVLLLEQNQIQQRIVRHLEAFYRKAWTRWLTEA